MGEGKLPVAVEDILPPKAEVTLPATHIFQTRRYHVALRHNKKLSPIPSLLFFKYIKKSLIMSFV